MKINIIVLLFSLFLSACATTPQSNQTQTSSKSANKGASVPKPTPSILEISSDVNSAILYLNENKWSYESVDDPNNPTEYLFDFKGTKPGGFLSGKLITEEIDADVQLLTRVAHLNAKKIDPNIQIILKEPRTINNVEVIYMEMLGRTEEGLDAKIMGIYHTDQNGATQLVVFALKHVADRRYDDIQQFFSGFAIAN